MGLKKKPKMDGEKRERRDKGEKEGYVYLLLYGERKAVQVGDIYKNATGKEIK